MRLLFLVFLPVLLVYVVGQVIRTQRFIRIGELLAIKAVPFSRTLSHPRLRILFVGDSTAIGTGASSSSTSIAGLVGQRYPDAEIVNFAVNGSKVRDVIRQLEAAEGSFDLIMMHMGGNDIVRFTPYEELAEDVRRALDLATLKGKHVLLTSTGNIGTVLLFPAPTRWIFDKRTRNVREIFMKKVAERKGDIRYTDLFRERREDPFALDPKNYYAADLFHPSDAGYQDWFGRMSVELDHFTF